MITQRAAKYRNRLVVALYRLTDGRVAGMAAGLPVLLLTVSGRRSGLPRTTPLVYFEDHASFIVLGSASGASTDPEWAKNLARAGVARVRVGEREHEIRARQAVGAERDRLWVEVIAPNLPSVNDYERKSGRAFPVFILGSA